VRAFDNNSGCVSQVANAIDFLVQIKQRPELNANVVVVNNSYGFLGQTDSDCQPDDNCSSKTLRAAVQRAGEYGMLFVAAAGNDSKDTRCYPVYPASFDLPNVISVAASDNRDELATFSNYGSSSVHLAAPGVGICSTVNNANLYGYREGTSMAAPFVSGAAALLWSRCDLGTAALKQALIDSVDRPLGLQDKTISRGRLNVANAVKACGGGPASE
jgi:subtilisin family serine protease